MAVDAHANFAYSTVLTAPVPATSGESLVVQSGDGAKFPTPPFNATVWPAGVQPTTGTGGNAEIVRVTGISTDTFTMTGGRAAEGTTARSIAVGYQIAATITAKTLTDVETEATPVLSYYRNLVPQNSAQPYTTLALTYNTLILQPLSPVEELGFPGDMTISTFLLHLSGTATATSATSAWSSSFSSTARIGLYSLVNSTQISLVNSVSTTWSRAANTQNSTNWAGPRFLTIHSSQWSSQPVLSYRTKYWWGVLYGSSNFSAMGPVMIGQYIGASTQRSGTVGVSQATNTSQGAIPFLGIYSSSLASIPGTLGNSQINKVHALAGFSPGIVLENIYSAF